MPDVVLPCLDEAAALPWVLSRMPAGYRPMVADNGSADGSADVARGGTAPGWSTYRAGVSAAPVTPDCWPPPTTSSSAFSTPTPVSTRLLFLPWFPLILGLAEPTYRAASGLGTATFLGSWLLVTGVAFALSAVSYALRLRRASAATATTASATP